MITLFLSEITGRKIGCRKEYLLGFGDYVEAYNPSLWSNDVTQKRTEPFIALYPSTNISGLWIHYNLEPERYVRRTYWHKLPMPQNMIDRMNVLAGDKLITAVDIIIDSKNKTDRTERIIPLVQTPLPSEVQTVETITAEKTLTLQYKPVQVAVEMQGEQM